MPQTLADAFSLLGSSGYDLGILLVVLPLSFLLGAVFFSHVNYQISWTTYFATINIIRIAVLGTKLQWHYMLSFVSGSHQFIVGVLISLQLCALGVLKAAAATGRSNNAYGHSGYSWFALLPLFDLILIFSKARSPPRGGYRVFITEFGGLLLAVLLFFIYRSLSNHVASITGG